MNIKSYLIVAMVLLATACANSTAKNGQTEEKQPIPEGAVEMQYNNHLNILLAVHIQAYALMLHTSTHR